MSFDDWETGENGFRHTRRHIVLPLAAVPAKKKRRAAKQVGQGLSAWELAEAKKIWARAAKWDDLVRGDA